tara:strand:+ start:607 stop:798 length:192 start_codon:yes stop_codon:yes gene_type:complete
MKPGDLVKIVWSEPHVSDDVGVFVSPDDVTSSLYLDGMRSLIFWEGEITSLPNMQLEVISETR